MPDSSQDTQNSLRKTALKFIVLLGIVSLLADMTYEGARSIIGPYLAILGASGTIVGIAAGFGEFVGYFLRIVSGYLTDKTGKYWLITITGYIINLFAVPILALAGSWEIAVALIIAERTGKAIRAPARDAMLSHATKNVGRGWGFGLHEAMDQIGAMLGPLIVAAILFLRHDYRLSFAWLLIPALLAITTLIIAKYLFPSPKDLEPVAKKLETKGFPKHFYFYTIAIGLVAAGFVDFSLIAFHLKKTAIISDNLIPVMYAIMMGIDAIAALLFGWLFDRIGGRSLIIAIFISSFFAPLIFLTNVTGAIIGMLLWGIGMGAQESIMRASIAGMIHPDRRGSAYGLFNAGYGVFWFLGSALMGWMYDVSLITLAIISFALQLASIPILIRIRKEIN